MAYVEIYQKGKLLSKEFFLQQFLFEENSAEGMVWETDVRSNSSVGTIMFWITGAAFDPVIHSFRPELTLLINGEAQEQKYYIDIPDLKGRDIEVSYKEYRLRFEFV